MTGRRGRKPLEQIDRQGDRELLGALTGDYGDDRAAHPRPAAGPGAARPASS